MISNPKNDTSTQERHYLRDMPWTRVQGYKSNSVKKKDSHGFAFAVFFQYFFPKLIKHIIYAASESLKAFCKLDLVGGLSYEKALHSAGMCNTGIEKHSNCS